MSILNVYYVTPYVSLISTKADPFGLSLYSSPWCRLAPPIMALSSVYSCRCWTLLLFGGSIRECWALCLSIRVPTSFFVTLISFLSLPTSMWNGWTLVSSASSEIPESMLIWEWNYFMCDLAMVSLGVASTSRSLSYVFPRIMSIYCPSCSLYARDSSTLRFELLSVDFPMYTVNANPEFSLTGVWEIIAVKYNQIK